MRFDYSNRRLIKTEKQDKIECFKCGKNRLIISQNNTFKMDDSINFYWCSKKEGIFCDSNRCKAKPCERNATEHTDYFIDRYEGF